MANRRRNRTKDSIELGISTLYLLGQNFDSLLRTLNRSKVKSWELFDDGLHSLDNKRADKLARISKSKGIAFTVHGPICDLNVASLSHELRPHLLRRMDRALRVSARLGARRWVLHPGTHGALSWIHKGEDWMVNLNNMKHLHNVGRKLGVEIVIENISAEQAILGKANDFQRLYNEWAHAPGITLDVGHSHIRRETDKYLRRFAGRIRHVHVHDNMGDIDNHLAVGSGTIPWRNLLGTLVDAGSVEEIVVESVKGPSASYDRVRKILRSLE